MTRKFVSMLLVLVLILAIPVMASAAATATVKLPYADGSLYVRSGPGVNYEAKTTVKNGEKITLLSEGKTWSKIRVNRNNITGYIKNAYFVKDDVSGTDGKNYDVGKVTTKYSGSTVHLRKGAGTKYGVVGYVRTGDRLSIYDRVGNWYLAKTTNGLSGYISKNYVTMGYAGRVTDDVNLRKGAGMNYSVIKVLEEGVKLTVLSVKGNWSKVKADKSTGYIYNTYYRFTR